MDLSYQLMPIKGKENCDIGSLLKLFTSEYFTISMHLQYLKKYFDNKGIHDYLINRLYLVPDHELEFYLPQLCYLLIKKESKELQQFLVEKCSESFLSYLKISLNLNAFGQGGNKKQKERMSKIETYCEISVVNGENKENKEYINSQIAANLPEFQEKIYLKYQEKEAKSNYHNLVMKFLNKLIKISLSLKTVKEIEQPKHLKEFLQQTNLWLHSNKVQMREEAKSWKTIPKSINLFEGILLPFANFEQDWQSNLVVRIIEDDFNLYVTRKRVPYKILIETIDVRELENFDINIFKKGIKKSQSTADNLSEGSNASNSNYSYTLNKGRSPIRKKELSPRLRDWEKIDDNIEEFDLFLFENVEELAQNELNKYQGLTSYAKSVEQNEKRTSFLKNGKNFQKKIEKIQKPENQEILSKVENFNQIYPVKIYSCSHSKEDLRNHDKIKGISRHSSETVLPILETLNFLDKMLENTSKMTQSQESKFKSLRLKISTENMLEVPKNLKKEVKKFGPWGDIWEDKDQFIKANSPYGHLQSYKLRPIIVKGGDDLRQEVLAMQIIRKLKEIFKSAKITAYLRPYEVIVTSANSGIIEFIPNTMSVDHLKKYYIEKKKTHSTNLCDIYLDIFGVNFEEAQKNFVESLAAYSIVCYLLNVKDRHNGNILIDNQGHIIHIDFGFMFNFTPGGIHFEKAPFKLTEEYLDLMGGVDSNMFLYFKVLLIKMLILLKKHVEELTCIISVMMEDSNLSCFQSFDYQAFKAKFGETSTETEIMTSVEKLIELSLNNWRTIKYDDFQRKSNGILP